MLHIWEHQNNIWWIMRLMMHFRSYSLTAGGPRKICTFVCTFELGYCRTLHITEALPLALAKRINGLNTAKNSAFHPCQHGFLVIFVSSSGVTSGKMSRLRISTACDHSPLRFSISHGQNLVKKCERIVGFGWRKATCVRDQACCNINDLLLAFE